MRRNRNIKVRLSKVTRYRMIALILIGNLSIPVTSNAQTGKNIKKDSAVEQREKGEVSANSERSENKTAATLMIDELINMALANNQELKAMEAEIRSAEAEIGPAGSLQDPMLGLSAMNVPVDSYSLSEDNMTGVEVSLRQMIPFPGKRAKLEEAASHLAQAKRELYEQKKWALIQNLKSVYYQLYLAYQTKELLGEQRAILRQLLATSRSQYTTGKMSQAALLNLQVEEASLIDSVLKVESEIKEKSNQLSHLLGHTGPHLMGSPASITKKFAFDLKDWTEDKIAEFVTAKSPKLRALRAQVNSQEANLAFAKKGYLPDFELMAGYMFRSPTRMGSEGTDMVSAGVGMTLPIWAGSKQSEQVKGAVAEKAKAEAEYRDARLMLEHEARAAFAELKEAQNRVKLFEDGLLQLTAQAVASGRSAYLTGKLDYAGLLEALRTQYRTNFAYQEALAELELKLAQLESLAAQSLGAKANETTK